MIGEPQELTYTDEYDDHVTVSGVHSVEFTATHVVFRDSSRRIIVAEEASSVRRLRQLGAAGTHIGGDMGGKPNPGTKRDKRLKVNKGKKASGGKRKR